MDSKANKTQNQVQNPAPAPASPISSGHPETGPIQQVERPVSDYTSYPAPPSNVPVIQPSPTIKLPDDIASHPSIKSVKGNLVNLKAAREKFEKGDVKESGTWEAGVEVYDNDKKKAA